MAKDKKNKDEKEEEVVSQKSQEDLVEKKDSEEVKEVHLCLTKEEKEAIVYLVKWATDLGRRSSSVEWRRNTKEAISKLSRLLND